MKRHATHFTADWFTGHAEEWLRVLGHLRDRPVRALEIGSYEGRSAVWFLENLLTNPASHLTCVDSWDGTDTTLGELTRAAHARFLANTAPWRQANRCRAVKSHSLVFLGARPAFGDPCRFDLIFVDGSHEGMDCLLDLLLCWQLLAVNGYLIMDDFCHEWPEGQLRATPQQAWEAFARMQPQGEIGTFGRCVYIHKDPAK